MSDQTPAERRSEADREATGISPEKWAAMPRADRREAARQAQRAPRDRQVRQPGRDR